MLSHLLRRKLLDDTQSRLRRASVVQKITFLELVTFEDGRKKKNLNRKANKKRTDKKKDGKKNEKAKGKKRKEKKD